MLSIIIPACNEEKYIGKTLKALKEQRYSDFEVIVVCNGCTDKTEEIAKSFTDKVIVVKERGVSRARNQGAKLAKGSKLVFLDADIVLNDRDTLKKIMESGLRIGTCYARPDVDKIVARILMGCKNKILKFGCCTGIFFCDNKLFMDTEGFDETKTIGEDGKLLRELKSREKFGVIDSSVINNMRRFEKEGYFSVMLYWVKEYILPSGKEYEIIR